MGLADVGTSAVLHFAFLASVVIGVLAALEEAEQLPGEIGGEELHSRILRREPDLHSLVDASFRVKVREVLATAQAGSFNLPIEIPKSQLFFSGCSASRVSFDNLCEATQCREGVGAQSLHDRRTVGLSACSTALSHRASPKRQK
jgi:hypothetical protein